MSNPVAELSVTVVQYDSSWNEQFIFAEGRFGDDEFRAKIDLRREELYSLEWYESPTNTVPKEFHNAMSAFAVKTKDRHRELMMRLVFEAVNGFSDPVATPPVT